MIYGPILGPGVVPPLSTPRVLMDYVIQGMLQPRGALTKVQEGGPRQHS